QVMLGVVDPAGNYAYEVHQYLDVDGSGTSPTCVSNTIGVERLTAFTQWLRDHGRRAFLGELAGGDNVTCRDAVGAMLDHIDANRDRWIGWSWWAAGPWWGNYFFTLEPSGPVDAPQLQWLLPHLRPGAARAEGRPGGPTHRGALGGTGGRGGAPGQ